jgi:hypothetical protein
MSDPALLVRAAFEHLNAHDLDAYYDLLTDDVDSIGITGRFEGKDAMGDSKARMRCAGIGMAFDAIPDHWRRIERIAVSDHSVATWITLGGTVAVSGETKTADRWRFDSHRRGGLSSLLARGGRP